MDYDAICSRVAAAGMLCRGGFHPSSDDGLPAGTGTAVMVGNAGSEFWRHFRAEFPPEIAAGADNPISDNPRPDNPMEVWSSGVLNGVAQELGATVLFPFGGPPHLPFMRWAQKAETVFPSPIGPLIHPTYGLWHAYRGILIFTERIAVPERRPGRSPCADCDAKPCLHSCPVGAMHADGFEIDPCIAHLASSSGGDCMTFGCAARRGCPVGAAYIYGPDQAQFHQRAFFRSHAP
jgi:hypothetical protein